MEIILTEDVDNLGLEGELVDVADGYARNFLLPQQMAVRSTPQNREMYQRKQQKIEQEHERREQEARELADRVRTLELVLEKNASEEGSLYGSVTQSEVAEAINEAGVEGISPKQVIIDERIRELGEYTVRVNLAGSVEAEVNLEVVPA